MDSAAEEPLQEPATRRRRQLLPRRLELAAQGLVLLLQRSQGHHQPVPLPADLLELVPLALRLGLQPVRQAPGAALEEARDVELAARAAPLRLLGGEALLQVRDAAPVGELLAPGPLHPRAAGPEQDLGLPVDLEAGAEHVGATGRRHGEGGLGVGEGAVHVGSIGALGPGLAPRYATAPLDAPDEPTKSYGNISDRHWTRSRKDSNQEALDYYRERSRAPGVAEGGGARNFYCMQCDGVIPADHDGDACPHCGDPLEGKTKRYFNWVEIDEPPKSDLAALLPYLAGGALVVLALLLLLLLS